MQSCSVAAGPFQLHMSPSKQPPASGAASHNLQALRTSTQHVWRLNSAHRAKEERTEAPRGCERAEPARMRTAVQLRRYAHAATAAPAPSTGSLEAGRLAACAHVRRPTPSWRDVPPSRPVLHKRQLLSASCTSLRMNRVAHASASSTAALVRIDFVCLSRKARASRFYARLRVDPHSHQPSSASTLYLRSFSMRSTCVMSMRRQQ